MDAGRQLADRGSGRDVVRAVLATVAAMALTLVTVACLPADDPDPGPSGTTTETPSGPRTTGPAPEPTPATTEPAPATTAPTPATTQPAPATTHPAPATTAPAPATPPAPALVPAAWRGADIEVLPGAGPVVALTFDGGASDAAVAPILATLDRYDVPATFFVTGAFARTYPDAVRAMAAAGHPVGNHSDTHPSFADSTNEVIRAELAGAEAAISALTGRTTRPLFRFPFGARTDLDVAVVNGEGYVPFRWSTDTLGWQGTEGGITADVVTDRVLGTARDGQIVLMHVGANPDDGTTLDADALPAVIEGLRARGYGFVHLGGVVR
ncbi:polysaccharide deacetylase family protein [Georgenia muralis]|uniref:polysaccharide deacetylase family protein n=1 Tax=Georgenia muralis TaxID=154117 RepID=UPI001FE44679|nr:polysaccharide deacetylase family protein [Georgenia muralis]